ncbi:helix-turn-helix transcriptional regulator [Cohnella sp. GbtcB17]|uniref:helix-turn-helix transcriptional regulator n=1 Tax=Cohnella sp. GbtcB17 TaxID=2824762 RepID=UPI001C30BBC1|nr:helix-turn-helix transcriptional regulator [Cohnella sp. GbtcB17]
MTFDLRKLRFERLSRKISQEEVAEVIGVKRPTYHKKENGKIKMSVEEFAAILDFFGIPEEEIKNFFVKNVPKREQNSA